MQLDPTASSGLDEIERDLCGAGHKPPDRTDPNASGPLGIVGLSPAPYDPTIAIATFGRLMPTGPTK